jgi:SAM-dependent methyltransferase
MRGKKRLPTMPFDSAMQTAEERREAAYFDGDAQTLTDEDLRSGVSVSERADMERLAWCGDLVGKDVLDVGCGSGQWAAILARAGARVRAIDISPGMVDATKRRAELLGLGDRIRAEVMSAMSMDFPDASFDVVHGQDVIHHVQPEKIGAEIRRILRPGGRAVFRESSGLNPVLLFARDQLCGRFGIEKGSTQDEYPLTPSRLRAFTANFATAEVSFPEFLAFRFIDVKILKHRWQRLSTLCGALDECCYRVGPLRRLSYRILIRCVKSEADYAPR